MQGQADSGPYRFGDVTVDDAAFRVMRAGRELSIEPKAIDVLLYLVQRPGQLISKHELIAAVWKDVAVTDNALTRVIAKLRRALGDDPHDCRYIETVPTRGYRFIAAGAAPSPVPQKRRVVPAFAAVAVAVMLAVAISMLVLNHAPWSISPGYEAYTRGVYFQGNRWMAGGCRNAERYLLESVARDPDFAPAFAALAWCYAYPDRIDRPITEIGPKAKASVARALELDTRLALAHTVLGTIRWRVDYDAVGAAPELEAGLALDPRSGLVRIPYAELLLWHFDRRDAGLAVLRPAIEFDPFSPDRQVQIGFVLMTVGLYDDAIALFRRGIELDPEYGAARLWLAEAYTYKDERALAIDEYLRWLDVSIRRERSAAARASLEQAYRAGGWHAFWQAELALVREEQEAPGSVWTPIYARYTGAYSRARRYARLGDWETALDSLETAYRERHHMLANIRVDPLFAPLRAHLRFRAMLHKIGAPPIE